MMMFLNSGDGLDFLKYNSKYFYTDCQNNLSLKFVYRETVVSRYYLLGRLQVITPTFVQAQVEYDYEGYKKIRTSEGRMF